MNPIYLITNDNPQVQAAIEYIVSLQTSYPLDHRCDEMLSTGPGMAPWTTYTTTFWHGAVTYTAISGSLAVYPQISITEMQGLGLLPK
jgi:hypothetical protein